MSLFNSLGRDPPDRALLGVRLGIESQRFDKVIEDLLRTTETDGVFCYTFFKAVGTS